MLGNLEGIVAKRRSDPHDPRTRWWKVKNPTYTQAQGRQGLFKRRESS
jgi:ATP-dependent DNA ligase